jgi:hypothetical protein
MDARYRALVEIWQNESNAMITHDHELPPERIQQTIARFARGSVTPQERAELCETLQERPEWITRLADEVRSLRTGGAYLDDPS